MLLKTLLERDKKRDARKRLFEVAWLDYYYLEGVTQTDEETLRLGGDVVVVLFLVDQTEAIASKQLGSVEFGGSAKYQVDVEGIHVAVVAIPFGGGGAAANGVLR